MQENFSIRLPLATGESFPIARAMAASFAAPLVSKLYRRSIVFHVYGVNTPEEELGLLTMAMSVWGDPKDLIYTFDDGFDYLAKKAATLHHLPVAIASSLPPNSSTLSSREGSRESGIIANENSKKYIERRNDWMYYLSMSHGENPCGAGNYKDAQKDTGVYDGNMWKTVFITTGKKALSYLDGQPGLRSHAIELDAAALAPAGELPALVKDVSAFQNNYGSAGHTYAKYLYEECTEEDFRADYNEFLNALLPYEARNDGKAHEAELSR